MLPVQVWWRRVIVPVCVQVCTACVCSAVMAAISRTSPTGSPLTPRVQPAAAVDASPCSGHRRLPSHTYSSRQRPSQGLF